MLSIQIDMYLKIEALEFDSRVILSFRSPFLTLRFSLKISERPNVRFRFGSSAELGGSARFGRTTEPADFTEPEPN